MPCSTACSGSPSAGCKLNQRDDARALYTRVITQFPGTAAATQAEQRLASLSP